MTGLGAVAVLLFAIGLFARAKLTARHEVVRVYVILAAGIGLFASSLSYLAFGVPATESAKLGAYWALLTVAMPLGNLVRDRVAHD